MNSIQQKQFLIDLDIDHDRGGHIFNTSLSNSNMRYWARDKGTIIITDGRLLVRTDDEQLTAALQNKYEKVSAQWFGEVSNLKELEKMLNQHGATISNYGPFFIPLGKLESHPEQFTYYDSETIEQFRHHPEFNEAFLFDSNNPDVLGVAIKVDDRIAAVAGMNFNGKYLLEIGINVIPEYQHLGLATQCVKEITAKAQQLYPNHLVTYGTQFSHNRSINVAIKSGFQHAWTEIVISCRDMVK